MGSRGHKLVFALAAAVCALAAVSCTDARRLRSAEDKARLAAEQQRRMSDDLESRRLAAEARSNIEKRPDWALLLALEAIKVADTPEASGALLEALESHPQIERYIPGRPGWIADLAFGAGGKLILRTEAQPECVFYWDPDTGRPDGEPVRFDERITGMALSPNGKTLAVVSGGRLHFLDFETRKLLRPPTPFDGGSDLVFGPSGVLAATIGWAEIRLWDALTGTPMGGPVQVHEDMVQSDAGGVFLTSLKEARWALPKAGLSDECSVTSLARYGNTLIAGTTAGIYRSKDHGTTWLKADSAKIGSEVGCLAASGTTVFAGTDVSDYIFTGEEPPGGIFQSRDDGASWVPLVPAMPHANARALATSGTDLFVGTDRGVYLYSGRGAGWSTLNSGLIETDVLCLAVKGPALFAGTDGGGVFRSTDGGASWAAVNSGLKNKIVRDLAMMGPVLFAGTDGGVFISVDDGAAWSEVNSGLADRSVHALLVEGERLFAGTKGGVYATSTHGAKWADFNAGLPASAEVTSLATAGDVLVAGTEGGGSSQSNEIGGLVFSPDGKTVLSGGSDGTIRFSTATSLAPCGAPVAAHRGAVRSLAFHPDGTTLASGGGDGKIRLWNWPGMTPAAGRMPLQSQLVKLSYTADGVLVSMGKTEIRRWNGKTLAEIGEPVPICQDRPDGLAVRSDGMVATGAGDGSVIIWKLGAGNRLLTRVRAHATHGAAFAGPDRLLAAGENGILRCWSMPDGRLLRESHAAGGQSIVKLAVSSSGRAAVGLDNGMIQFSDPETGHLAPPVFALNGMVHGLTFNAAGDRLAACDFIPGSLAIVDLRTNAPAVPSVNAGLGDLSDLALSLDEKVVAAAGENGLRLFDARDLRPLTGPIKFPTGLMSCLTFTPDGKLAVTGGSAITEEAVISVLDGRTGKAGPEIRTPPIHKLLVVQEGKLLAGGGYKGEVRLWDLRTLRPVGVLRGREGWVARNLNQGPAGKLVVAFDNGDVEIWDIDPDSWKARARLIANRELTSWEKKRFLETAGGGVR